jgi:hypothetical protein
MSPDELGNTISPILGWDWMGDRTQAGARLSGRRDHSTGYFGQWTERCAGLGIGQSCCAPWQIHF